MMMKMMMMMMMLTMTMTMTTTTTTMMMMIDVEDDSYTLLYIYICLHIIIYELLYITSKSLGMKISSKNPMAYMVGLYPLDLINYQWRKSWFHGIYWDLWGYMMVYPLVN